MDIRVEPLTALPVAAAPVEMVERKGLGHPDSLCDALAEELSRALARFYLERFGLIMHHNVDKGLLYGGAARAAFGGGEVLAPIEIYLTGRATRAYRGVTVPVEELAVEGSRAWLRRHLRYLDPQRHVRIHCLIRPSSSGLVELFLRSHRDRVALANDTSFGVGFAPLDELEQVVGQVERALNGPECKRAQPHIGEDIKVMGVRQDRHIALTVACAFVDRHVTDLDDYRAKKAAVAEAALATARALSTMPCTVEVNSADGDSADAVYLTVTGTSAEAGDDGQVGRGNRANGLITPYRPMSLEAVAGKNPVTHVGKLYNVVGGRIARALRSEVSGCEEAYCFLVSRIGRPIAEPQVVDVKLRLAEPGRLVEQQASIAAIVRAELDRIGELWRALLAAQESLH